MKSLLTIVILFFGISISHSQDLWIPLATTTNGITTYYRQKDIKSEGSIIITWLKQAYLPNDVERFRTHFINYRRRNNLSIIGFDKLAYALVRNSYDCKRNKMRTTRMIYYNTDGREILSEETSESRAEWIDIAPESISELILEEFCKKK